MANSYTTGTVSVTNGSAIVTGSGTAWNFENVAGGMFRLGTFEAEIIAATNTQLTLDANYTGATASGQAYRIWLQDAQAASNITINRQLGEIIARLVGSAPEIQDFLDADNLSDAQTALGISTFIKTLLDSATLGEAQTALGISTFIKTLLDDANAAAARVTLGADNAANLTGTIPFLPLRDSAAIPYASGADATTDINSLTSPGFAPKMYGTGNANLPASGFWYILTLQFSTPGTVTQVAIPYGNAVAASGTHIRGLYNGSWSAWQEIALKSFVEANYPAKPKTAAGAGQWVAISSATNTAYALPAGGTWAFVVWQVNTSTNVFSGGVFCNISAGGTTIQSAVANQGARGFAWRISE